MAQIFVMYETIKADAADRVASILRESGHEVRTLSHEHYPIADSLEWMLFGRVADSLMGFVIISNSPKAYSWVLRELLTINRIEERKCLCPIFTEGVEPPAWLIEKNEHWLRIGDITPANLEEAIHRAGQKSETPH